MVKDRERRWAASHEAPACQPPDVKRLTWSTQAQRSGISIGIFTPVTTLTVHLVNEE